MKISRNIGDDKRTKKPSFIAISANICFLILFLAFVMNLKTNSNSNVNAEAVRREQIEPDNYNDLEFSTSVEAVDEANSILLGMTDENLYGVIYTIDKENPTFMGRLFIDYNLGGCIYWVVEDDFTSVSIDAYSGEILSYDHTGWSDGAYSAAQSESRAENIIEYFLESSIPSNSEGPVTSSHSPLTWSGMDQSGEVAEEEWTYWYVQYNRTKDNINSVDTIFVMIDLSGNLAYFNKAWHMDFSALDTTYSVTQSQAESTALTYDGTNNEVKRSEKRIVRPDYFWVVAESPLDEITNEPYITYGLPPVCVWEVWIKDSEDNLCIYFVHGQEDRIVGGDFSHEFYLDDSTGGA